MAKGKRNRVVGFTIDAGEMRAAEVSGSPQHFKVTALGSAPLEPGLMSEGVPADIPAIASIFSSMLRQNGFSPKTDVVIGAKNQNVLLRMATFPQVPEDKLRNVVTYQAQQYIPIPMSELTLDYVKCGTTEESGQIEMNLLLVGAKKVFLDSAIELCGQAGRTVAEIDSAALATMRAVSAIHQDDGMPYMIADVDYETTGMMVCRGDVILMARTAGHPSGFGELLRGRHEDLMLDEMTMDLAAGYLSDDIRASMQYFAINDRSPMSRVYLISRFAQMDDIARSVGEKLGIPVAPPYLYPSAAGVDTIRYGTCISLALRGLEV